MKIEQAVWVEPGIFKFVYWGGLHLDGSDGVTIVYGSRISRHLDHYTFRMFDCHWYFFYN